MEFTKKELDLVTRGDQANLPAMPNENHKQVLPESFSRADNTGKMEELKKACIKTDLPRKTA